MYLGGNHHNSSKVSVPKPLWHDTENEGGHLRY